MRRLKRMTRTDRGTRPFVVVLVLALAAVALLPAVASAATWTSGVGGAWSIGSNWSGLTPPVEGDDLTFPSGVAGQATNDLVLTRFGSAGVSGSTMVGGNPLALTGSLSMAGDSAWNPDTWLADNLAVNVTGGSSVATVGGSFYLAGLEIGETTYESSSLTFNVGSGDNLYHGGSIVGNDPQCAVTKSGDGTLRLGWGGDADAPWLGSSNWAGPTTIQQGRVTVWNPGALSSNSDVTVASGASLRARFGVDGYDTGVWQNAFSGSGDIDVTAGELVLRGNSMSFNGTTTVNSGTELNVGDTGFVYHGGNVQLDGTLRGQGATGTLNVNDGGVLSPGGEDYDVSSLWADDSAVLGPGGSYDVDVAYANTADGLPGFDWDFLQVTDGAVNITATQANPFTIRVRSSEFGSPGFAEDFDPDRRYRWSVVWTPYVDVVGFDTNKFVIDTSEFQNWFYGDFSLEQTADSRAIQLVYSPVRYDVTPSAGAHGSISPDTVQSISRGGSCQFDITPDAHYHVKDVLVDGVSKGPLTSYTFTNVRWDRTIHATFEIDKFTITPSAGSHGSISPGTAQTVDYGSDKTFAITPDTGYRIDDVLVDGVSVGALTSYTFTAVDAQHTISATFVPNTYTLTPSAGPNGSITPGTAQTVTAGNDLTFTITPDAHYHVADVLVDGVSVGAVTSYTFTNVTANHTIAVSFAIDTYTITPSAGANGSISPATVQTVSYGGSRSFTHHA